MLDLIPAKTMMPQTTSGHTRKNGLVRRILKEVISSAPQNAFYEKKRKLQVLCRKKCSAFFIHRFSLPLTAVITCSILGACHDLHDIVAGDRLGFLQMKLVPLLCETGYGSEEHHVYNMKHAKAPV